MFLLFGWKTIKAFQTPTILVTVYLNLMKIGLLMLLVTTQSPVRLPVSNFLSQRSWNLRSSNLLFREQLGHSPLGAKHASTCSTPKTNSLGLQVSQNREGGSKSDPLSAENGVRLGVHLILLYFISISLLSANCEHYFFIRVWVWMWVADCI